MSDDAPSPSLVRQLLQLARDYWNCPHRWRVRGAVLLLVLLTEAQVGLAIWISYWNRELFDALEARQTGQLLVLVLTFVLIFALTMLVTAVHLHVKRWLQLDWRRWLTDSLLLDWLPRASHYQQLFNSSEHDNPDGRIAEDIRIATEVAIALWLSLLYSVLILGSFIDILLSLSGSLPIPGTGIEIPGYLVLLAFLFAGIGTLFGLLLGEPLGRATNRLQAVEASLRFGLARARENAESIALMRGEEIEQRTVHRLFDAVAHGWNRQTLGYLGIVSFSTGYGTLLPVFPILIAAPQYMAGAMSLGVLMQAAQAFQRLTSALSWPIDNLGELARCRASTDRVVSLYTDMHRLQELETSDVEHRIERQAGDGDRLQLIDLCLAGPDGQILIEHLGLDIERGEHLLINGDSGVASSLFKAVAGLWPWGNGRILLPAGAPMMFVPQQPFLPDGPLRAALCYPLPSGHFSPEALQHALHCAGLDWLRAQLDDSESWQRALPLRTLQRLAIARLILHRPAWVFIQEATDAFDSQGDDSLLAILLRELPDSTLICVSFHSEQAQFFQRSLHLQRIGEARYLSCASPDEGFCTLRKV